MVCFNGNTQTSLQLFGEFRTALNLPERTEEGWGVLYSFGHSKFLLDCIYFFIFNFLSSSHNIFATRSSFYHSHILFLLKQIVLSFLTKNTKFGPGKWMHTIKEIVKSDLKISVSYHYSLGFLDFFFFGELML